MTPDDRDLVHALRRQQADLQHSLARIGVQLDELESRLDGAPNPTLPATPPPYFPPVPHHEPPPLPQIPVATAPVHHPLPPLPPTQAPASKRSLESQFGRWLTAIGAVFGVITLGLIFNWTHTALFRLLGPAGILGLSALASVGVLIAGERLGRRADGRRYVGRVLTAMALAWLYLTAYAAYYFEPLRVIHSPILAGLLLLAWSAYVFVLAERKKSQTLAIFAVALAYFSTAINPIGRFTMAADLLLAGTAVLFLVRNGWATLSYLSLIGTYFALLRRLVVDENGELVLDTSRSLSFWPHAVYLIGAWIIFTAAVMFSTAPDFRGGKRLGFLSLNNGAWSMLLVLTAYIAGYGHGPMGWVLLVTGLVLLVTSRFVGWTAVEPEEAMAAYAAQGLVLVTAGIIVVYTGITRGFILMMETFFLGMAGAFAGDIILVTCTYVTGFFATLFLTWEIVINAHHPWMLGLGGAAVMLVNAWWARSEIRNGPQERSTIVLSSCYYCVLAIGLVFTAMYSELSARALPPGLALAALALTFLIYFVSIYELPPLAQILLLIAQALVLFPVDTGETLPGWSTKWVAGVTLLMSMWWARQRVTRTGPWSRLLLFVYALVLAGLAYQHERPRLDEQDWMVMAALLSVAFLVGGAFARLWALALVGQLFLADAVWHFFYPDAGGAFPWAWWAAMMPLVVVFSTARATCAWLRLSPEIRAPLRRDLRAAAYIYQGISLAMLMWGVHEVMPVLQQIATYLLLGLLVLVCSIRPTSVFGLRSSFILSAAGLWIFMENFQGNGPALCTFPNALVFLSLLIQPYLLRRIPEGTLSRFETWTLILGSVAAAWLFFSLWVQLRFGSGYLTLGWAVYGLFIFLLGIAIKERRMAWCGPAILFTAIVRVFLYDFWGLSTGYKILTFLGLTVITFILGYLILKNADRAKRGL